MSETLTLLLVTVIIAVIVFFLYDRFGRYLLQYRLEATGIRVTFLGPFGGSRIPFANIAEVREVPGIGWNLLPSARPVVACRWGNRIFGRGVLIRLRTGFIKSILITPDNPDYFIEFVRERVKEISEANE
ncbi:MAG: hypothetical protein ABSG53_19775 [Thermoguttaceae bacterium]